MKRRKRSWGNDDFPKGEPRRRGGEILYYVFIDLVLLVFLVGTAEMLDGGGPRRFVTPA